MAINPDPVGSPTFRPQNPVRGEDMRRLAERAEQAIRAGSTVGVADVGAGGGLQIGEEPLPDGFWARITRQSIALYSWVEVIDDGTGFGWTFPNGGNSGDFNAFEINGNVEVPADLTNGVIVWMSPLAMTGFYKFYWKNQPEIVLIGAPAGNGLFNAVIQQYDPVGQDWVTLSNILVVDANA